MASACSYTQGASSYYTLIGRGTTAEFDCTSATRVLVIRSYTDDKYRTYLLFTGVFQPDLHFILDYDYRLIDSTDCDKSRLRLHRKHIYIDIYRTCDIASLHNIECIGLKTIFYFLYGNKRDHTLVMDLTSLYSDFVMDGREVLFHSTPGGEILHSHVDKRRK